MASVGDWRGVYDGSNLGDTGSKVQGPPVQGFLAFLLWRAAYWTRQVSLSNKMLIAVFWLKSAVFGRDVSRF
jgi:NADH dehydrogenase FAD-containing subunit